MQEERNGRSVLKMKPLDMVLRFKLTQLYANLSRFFPVSEVVVVLLKPWMKVIRLMTSLRKSATLGSSVEIKLPLSFEIELILVRLFSTMILKQTTNPTFLFDYFQGFTRLTLNFINRLLNSSESILWTLIF